MKLTLRKLQEPPFRSEKPLVAPVVRPVLKVIPLSNTVAGINGSSANEYF